MGRLEKFKEMRRNRRRYLYSFLFLFSFLISGICVTDYSINSLMKNEKCIKIVSFQNDSSQFKISIMNRDICLDTSYINRDFQNIRNHLAK